MNKIIIVLLFTSSIYSQDVINKYFGLDGIKTVNVYKIEFIWCTNSHNKIYCKTEIRPDVYNNILRNSFIDIDTLDGEPYRTYSTSYGYIIINNSKLIEIYDSFLYPCDTSKDLINSIKIDVDNQIRYSLKSKGQCDMLNNLYWKEISKGEYIKTKMNLKYDKPSFGYIDSNFTSKSNFKIDKIEVKDSKCEKEYIVKRIKR